MKVGEKLDDVSGNIKRCVQWCAGFGSVCMHVYDVSIQEPIPTLTGQEAAPQDIHTIHTLIYQGATSTRTYCAGFSKSLTGLHFSDL